MIYLDTSCLLKLLRDELESPAVRAAVETEEAVVISSLTELETEVQLKVAAAGGEIHLAAVEELKLTRLMTLDNGQAKAARALNYRVVCPTR